GSNAAFSVTATGSGQLFYQWQKNGTNLSNGGQVSGADTPNLTLSQLQTNDACGHTVLVSNDYGAVTSAVATLTVFGPAPDVGQPTNQVILAGSNVTFSVAAVGTAPLSFFWYSSETILTNGGRISGATNSILTISNVQTNDAGLYKVIVTNLYGADTSAVAAL